MPTPSRNQIIAAAGAGFVAIVVAIATGQRAPVVNPSKTQITVDWPDGGSKVGAQCVSATGYAKASALEFFRLKSDAGPKYVYIPQLCAVPTENEEQATLPGGMESIEVGETFEYTGGPQLIAQIDEAAEWPCACSTGSQCERMDNAGNWVSADSWNNIIHANKWRGAGCKRMSCVQLFGAPSPYPAECVQ